LLGLLAYLYHKYGKPIYLLQSFYTFLLEPFFDVRIGNVLCNVNACIEIEKDCIGIYTYLFSVAYFTFLCRKIKKLLLGIFFIIPALSFLFNLTRLIIISAFLTKSAHVVFSLLTPLLGLAIAYITSELLQTYGA